MYISNLKQAYKLLGTIIGTACTAIVASLEEKNLGVATGLTVELIIHLPIILVAALVAPIAIVIPQVRDSVLSANENIDLLKPAYENISQMNKETWKLIYEIICAVYAIMDWLRERIIEPVDKTCKMVGNAAATIATTVWDTVKGIATTWWNVMCH